MGDFRMPSLGADMEKGTIVEWRVSPGDAVTRGDIVAVVDTEKSDIEIETFESGTVADILVPVGAEVPVGTVIATIVGATATAPPKPPPATAPPPAPTPVAVAPQPPPARKAPPAPKPAAVRPSAGGARPRVSPRARRRAAETGVDLDAVVAAAAGQPVDAADVDAFMAGRAPPAAPVAAPPPPPRATGLGAVGRLMERSKREIPHFYVSEDIDASAALDWLEARNADRTVAERILPAALLLRAVVIGLRDVPELNAHVVDGVGQPIDEVHLAVAVAQRGGGLIAPVIRDAQTLGLDDLMGAMRGIVGRARGGALRSSDVDRATITVTNVGEQGAMSVFGVIVPPQAAIIGFGRIAERPWAVSGMLTVRRVVTATLSADHRVAHGHVGGRLLRSIARALENPEVLA
jgi:pyruvate dehydrogenase E2 component (dihydrolipoamide acetyltransferase)